MCLVIWCAIIEVHTISNWMDQRDRNLKLDVEYCIPNMVYVILISSADVISRRIENLQCLTLW